MYLVAKGECVIHIRDEKSILIKNYATLTSGQYFGEIGLVYGYPRTASVYSRKYSTLAKLSHS